jgi:CO/xanthine dehydrogenase Mo-binding subunit
MVVGRLVENAARALRQVLLSSGLLAEGGGRDAFLRACGEHVETLGPLRASSRYEAPPGLRWDDTTYQGDAYGAYAWAVYVAEISVDTTTFETHVEDFVALQEVGKVIHPVLAAGQIEGGVAQAIGYALYENVVWREGRMANGQMTNYIMPTSVDPRVLRGTAVRVRPRRREGHRRAADGRRGAGHRQRAGRRDRRAYPFDPRHA